jgi:hypothetical protein
VCKKKFMKIQLSQLPYEFLCVRDIYQSTVGDNLPKARLFQLCSAWLPLANNDTVVQQLCPRPN